MSLDIIRQNLGRRETASANKGIKVMAGDFLNQKLLLLNPPLFKPKTLLAVLVVVIGLNKVQRLVCHYWF